MSRPTQYSLGRLLAVGLLLACFVGGVVATRRSRSEVREYEVARERERPLTSEVLRDQFPSFPFDWTVPTDWREASNNQFSKFAWTAGPADSEARITVSDLPESAGIEPQFIRWQGQLQVPESEAADVLKSVEEIPVGVTSGRWVEINGESESILGMIVPHAGKLWVFKYRSANATAKLQGEEFRKFCESLKAG